METVNYMKTAPAPKKYIPTLDDDLANISKLPYEPSEEEGFNPDVFQAEFDKAGLSIQKYVNDLLVPAIIAGRIPFAKTSAIQAEDIQAAIEDVQQQIVETAEGNIPNGSVTAEKLSEGLLKRTFGGVPHMSLDAPTEADNFAAGYPIGQEWISPRFEVVNLDNGSWNMTNGTVEKHGNRLTFAGDKTLATLTATQSVSAAGEEGDRCYVLFSLGDKDPEITQITAQVNTETVTLVPGVNRIPVSLLSGGVTVVFKATWPTASVADGSFIIDNFTICNTSVVSRGLPGIVDMQNWGRYLESILPFTTHISDFSGWVQVTNGRWTKEIFEVLPENRGGTGLNTYAPGQMLYADENGKLQPLAPPTGDSYLRYNDVPQWHRKDQVIQNLGVTRIMSGTYNGTGQTGSITLPVTPKLITISPPNGIAADVSDWGVVYDHPWTLVPDCEVADNWHANGSAGYRSFTVYVKLSGNTLSFRYHYGGGETPRPHPYAGLCNRSGVTYHWVALY